MHYSSWRKKVDTLWPKKPHAAFALWKVLSTFRSHVNIAAFTVDSHCVLIRTRRLVDQHRKCIFSQNKRDPPCNDQLRLPLHTGPILHHTESLAKWNISFWPSVHVQDPLFFSLKTQRSCIHTARWLICLSRFCCKYCNRFRKSSQEQLLLPRTTSVKFIGPWYNQQWDCFALKL